MTTHATTPTSFIAALLPASPADPADPAAAAVMPGGAVQGTPRVLLRLEGLATLVAATSAFALLGGGWGWFFALFLVPDLSLLGYLAGPRTGAIVYNAGHSYVGAALLAGAGVLLGAHVLYAGAAIWCSHIGFDRALGYGLKYAGAFSATHLGTIGRRS
jgi:hypothetical protein